jgi:Ice-binding-like/Putative Ig domain
MLPDENRRLTRLLFRGAVLTGLLGCASLAAAQASAPSLGSAQSFAIVAGSAVTNTGPTLLSGDLAVSPGTAVTGFPPGQFLSGGIHAADAAALAAQNSVALAYGSLVAQTCTQNLTGQNLGGLTLTPGVYCFDTSAQLTGILTLDGQGNPGAVFVFKIGSTLTTASGSSVNLIGGASPCNLFWQVGSSATLGTGSSFVGNVLALTSITVTTGTSLTGRALARNGAVTLDTNAITAPCAVITPACPAIALSPAIVPAGTVGLPYSQLITASGGVAPYTFTVVGGTLPAGLSLSASGLLAGTPSVAASSTFTVRAVDANSCPGTIPYTIVVSPAVPPGCPAITVTPPTAPGGTVGIAYSQLLAATGGAGPYSFSLTAGTPPAGLTLTPAGLLAGTPTAVSSSTFTVRALDVNTCPGTLAFTVVIAPAVPPVCPAITLTPAAPPNGTVGIAYSQTIAGSGGTAPYTFTLMTGTLPAGITLTPAGLLAGTPTTSGSASFTLRGTDVNGCFAEAAATVLIATAVPTLPQLFVVLLALCLMAAGYVRLRQKTGG